MLFTNKLTFKPNLARHRKIKKVLGIKLIMYFVYKNTAPSLFYNSDIVKQHDFLTKLILYLL